MKLIWITLCFHQGPFSLGIIDSGKSNYIMEEGFLFRPCEKWGLGIGEWFYPKYVAFLESAAEGIALLRDSAAAARSPLVPKELLEELLTRLPQRNRSSYSALAVELLENTEIVVAGKEVGGFFSEAILDPQLIKLERFLFLTTATIVWYACHAGEPGQS